MHTMSVPYLDLFICRLPFTHLRYLLIVFSLRFRFAAYQICIAILLLVIIAQAAYTSSVAVFKRHSSNILGCAVACILTVKWPCYSIPSDVLKRASLSYSRAGCHLELRLHSLCVFRAFVLICDSFILLVLEFVIIARADNTIRLRILVQLHSNGTRIARGMHSSASSSCVFHPIHMTSAYAYKTKHKHSNIF